MLEEDSPPDGLNKLSAEELAELKRQFPVMLRSKSG